MGVEAAFEVGRLYAPVKAIADAFTSPQGDVFLRTPGIEGHYPMSVVSGSGLAINHTGAGGSLTQTGVCPVGYDGNAYRQLGAGTDFLGASGVYGLTGLETFISSSIRGFTIGGWFQIDSVPGNASGFISKATLGGQIGYIVHLNTDLTGGFTVSVDGTASVAVNFFTLSLSQWYFIAARFTPSSEIAVFVNSVKTVNTTSIPASCFVSSQNFEVGRYFNDNTRIIHAKVRDVFIARAALSDGLIESIRLATVP